jgi:hypothetical protein
MNTPHERVTRTTFSLPLGEVHALVGGAVNARPLLFLHGFPITRRPPSRSSSTPRPASFAPSRAPRFDRFRKHLRHALGNHSDCFHVVRFIKKKLTFGTVLILVHQALCIFFDWSWRPAIPISLRGPYYGDGRYCREQL